MPQKQTQPQKKEPHGVGLFLMFLIILVLVSAIVLITQEGGKYELIDISVDEPFSPEEHKSGHLSSVYRSQHDTFFVPKGFPKGILPNGYADINEASFYENKRTGEVLHTYVAFIEGDYTQAWDYVNTVLQQENFKVEEGYRSMIAERSYEQLTLRFLETEETEVQRVEIEFWQMDR